MKNICKNMVIKFKIKKSKKKILSKIKIWKKICKLKLIIYKFLINLKNLLLFIFNLDKRKLMSLENKHQIYHIKKQFKKLTKNINNKHNNNYYLIKKFGMKIKKFLMKLLKNGRLKIKNCQIKKKK